MYTSLFRREKRSSGREKRSSDAAARLVDMRTSSAVACCTGFRKRLVSRTLMMGTTDITADHKTNGEAGKQVESV